MSGYSSTPLPAKLGITCGTRLHLHNAPDGFEQTLGHESGIDAEADVIVLFVEWRQELESKLASNIAVLSDRGGLWIAWPKKASKRPTDLTEDVLREIILPLGLVDNKVCAIDEVWSGLRFVRRRR